MQHFFTNLTTGEVFITSINLLNIGDTAILLDPIYLPHLNFTLPSNTIVEVEKSPYPYTIKYIFSFPNLNSQIIDYLNFDNFDGPETPNNPQNPINFKVSVKLPNFTLQKSILSI